MNKLEKEDGFTLVEMLIVLMIISVLLLIIVPNMSKNNEIASGKGCEATIKLLQAQVHAYKLEKEDLPASLEVLTNSEYVDNITCPNGAMVNYDPTTGNVTPPSQTTTE
ncbi:competence type IV pilus major pilin ComGC [Alkalihalobacillus deserti]|uniref:competence type IV pilus major pilin ComGC n=1 Tax=Alkalihalobacillus deserti TaxID=2879466 RepID=UPI001D1374E7|nr:competence type IV pilus major pilin ComGC [Alkalihalobacillus deserti]